MKAKPLDLATLEQPAYVGRPAAKLDGKLLSTAVAGGFVGTTLGLHARLGAPTRSAPARSD
jgi:hypothetical protein